MRKKLLGFLSIIGRIPAAAVLILPTLLGIVGNAAPAQYDENSIKRYAPVLYFEQGETCFPVNVSYHIDNSYLYRLTGYEPLLISDSSHDVNLSGYSMDNYYPDVIGTVDNEKIIEDYQSKLSSLGYAVYAHIYNTGNTMNVIQHWMFYAFNNGQLDCNKGGWEMVQVLN